MTRKHQKELEKIYAMKAGELLGETWNVEPSPDEASWPDLIVTTELGKFGLEVREIYPDESIKGSTRKANEKNNLKNIKKLADAYYKVNCSSIKADLLGDIEHHDWLLKAIIAEVPQLSEFEQKRIEPYSGCVIYIRKLPDHLGKYKRWNYVSDKVGWVRNMNKEVLDRAIGEKAEKLPQYTKNISDIRLLLVSNRLYNSGRDRLNEEFAFNARGFNKIYYFLYPDEVWQLTTK